MVSPVETIPPTQGNTQQKDNKMKSKQLWEIESLAWKIHNLRNYIQEWREREPNVLHRRYFGWNEKMNKLQFKLRAHEDRLKELTMTTNHTHTTKGQ